MTALAGRFGPDVHFVEVDAGNVGAARAAGFEYARSVCGGADPARTWYATSDADSVVPADWLLRMTATDADMVLGVVRVPDWRHFPPEVARRYLRAYQPNLEKATDTTTFTAPTWASAPTRTGLSAASAPCATGEDVELVERFEAAGDAIHRDATLSVVDLRPPRRPRARRLRVAPACPVEVGAKTQDRRAGVIAGATRAVAGGG